MIEELYTEFELDIRRFACSIARDNSEAEDLLQETFLRAMSNMVLLKTLPCYKQKSWLFRVCKNIMIDKRRRERFETNIDDQDEFSLEFADISNIEMMDLIKVLPSHLHDIVFKKYWLGMNSSQIAQALAIPPATVRSRLHSAIKILRTKMID